MINDPNEIPVEGSVPITEPLIPQRENQLKKGTAGVMVVSIFMLIFSIFLMIPYGPQNTDAAFNIQEKIFLIFASVMLFIATIVEGLFISGLCCNFGVAAAAVFLPSSILYAVTINLNSNLFWSRVTMIPASVLLVISGGLYLAHYLFSILLEVPKKRIVSGVAAALRVVASVLFMVAGIVEIGQTERGEESAYDFSIFRNLMFSGACMHSVAAIVAAVGQFVDPSM